VHFDGHQFLSLHVARIRALKVGGDCDQLTQPIDIAEVGAAPAEFQGKGVMDHDRA
jgi:hypothetical protein